MLLGVVAAVVVHALALLGLYLLPERDEEREEPECPTQAERCRARCEGRRLDVPSACPSLESYTCEVVAVELVVPQQVVVPQPLAPEPEPAPEPAPASEPIEAAPPVAEPRRGGRGKRASRDRTKEIARILGTYGSEGGGSVVDVLSGSGEDISGLFSEGAGLTTRAGPSLSEAVRRRLSSLRSCRDGAHGKLSLSITVDDRGAPTTVKVRRDTTDSVEVRDCVVKRVEGWTLPAGRAGAADFDVVFED